MSSIGHNFPPAELPIPEDVQPGPGWTQQMIEMADHIGAYATLRIVERHGGQYLYIQQNPDKNRFRDLIGARLAAIVSHVYGGEMLHIPTARYALTHARRQPVIRRVRAREISVSEAARILRTTTTYMSHLVNHTEEGCGFAGAGTMRRIPGQMDLFGDDEAE